MMTCPDLNLALIAGHKQAQVVGYFPFRLHPPLAPCPDENVSRGISLVSSNVSICTYPQKSTK